MAKNGDFMQAHFESYPSAQRIAQRLKKKHSNHLSGPNLVPVTRFGSTEPSRHAELTALPSSPSPEGNCTETQSGLAHDAANLLGAIGLYCDLLDLPGTLQPQHKHYAQELRALSVRGESMLRQLLPRMQGHVSSQDQSHAGPSVWAARPGDASYGTERPAPLQSPSQTLRQLEPLLRRLAGPQVELHLAMAAPSGDAELALDAETLERIVVNLTLNAAQGLLKSNAAQGPGKVEATAPAIHVTLRRVARHLCLSVSDNGPGLPAEVAEALLHPSAVRPASVRGHGHRVVHQLAAETGGKIAFRSTAGEGTTITVRWPVPVLLHSPATTLLPFCSIHPSEPFAAALSRPLNVC